MVSYCSIIYLVLFLPVVLVAYSIANQKSRPYVLLVSSYIFFFLVSEELIVYILGSTLVTYLAGIKIHELDDKSKTKKRVVLIFTILFHLALLFVLKYTKFFIQNINDILAVFKADFQFVIPKILAPIGISFYSLQAISYISDVYNKKYPPDKNMGRLALYLCYFPYVMEGPICRYNDVAPQLWNGEKINIQSLQAGFTRILYGLIKKIVIADRLNIFIKDIYKNFDSYDGGMMAVAAVFYTIQLYMEFSGTMDVVIGSSHIFGINLTENFKQPFFSKTISEFWTRWHITLGLWFKDYIYIPVSMSKKSKKMLLSAIKKYGRFYGPFFISSIALFCVWLSNGLWHGSGWRYIFFGMYHFVLISICNIVNHYAKKFCKKHGINRNALPYRIMQIIRTSVLVCIGEMFFRADGLKAGFKMFYKLVTDFSFKSITDGTMLKLGMDKADYIVAGLTLILVLIISIIKEKGINPLHYINEKPTAFKWALWYAMLFFIIIFGAYGSGYTPIDPIYADF